MKPTIQSVRGTRDFYPEDMAVRAWLYRTIAEVASSFGYQEIDGPFLEKLELYAAKSGEELVKEQAFVFNDRGGDQVTLRPELTPTVARMVAQRQNELVFPLRWWSFGPFWRYEKPQKGRSREFFQWNIDMIGPTTPEADAELVAVGATFFQKIGLSPEQVQIHINDRKLMEAELALLGVTTDRKAEIFHLIDRRDKMVASVWDAYALERGFSVHQLEQLKIMLSDGDLWKKSPELTKVFTILERMGLRDYLVFDAGVIRGLDYYTGSVFEARDASSEGRAVLGGGRYDNLVGDVGGDTIGAVGFAMGDVMATLVLRKYGCIPVWSPSPAPVMVTVFDGAHMLASFALASDLRKSGLKVVVYPEAVKLQKQFKTADRMGVLFAVIQGPDEEEKGLVTVKDLRSGEQKSMTAVELAGYLKNAIL